MNWNYGIRLSGKPERFVMRFYDRAPDACAKEARILARLGADVPVPRVLHAEVRGIGGYPPFCVLEFIDGISLRELRRRSDVKGVADASYDVGGRKFNVFSEGKQILSNFDVVGEAGGKAIALLISGEEFGIHHIAGGGYCSWYDFAQEIFDQAGVECHVMAGTTEMLARPAPRPAYSVLGTERRDPIRLPHWRQGLTEYLAERQAARQEAAA